MKKIYFESFLESFCKICMIILFLGAAVQAGMAQTPLYYKTGTATSGTAVPWGQSSQKTQLLYAPGDFNATPLSGYITRIYFRNSAAAATGTYEALKINFFQTADPSFPSTSFYTGLTTALASASYALQGNSTAGGWLVVPLQTPYLYDNTKSLVVEMQYTSATGGIATTTTTSAGNKNLSGTSLTNTTGTVTANWNDFGIDVIPAVACTSAPVPGKVSYSTQVGCAGRPLQFILEDHSVGSGITFQWQSAASASGPYTGVSGQLSSPFYETTAPAGISYFRCAVTCSGNTSYSDTVTVTGSVAMPAGTYTINKNDPTAGTNFRSFKDAIAVLSCGIAGPIVFNVVPGTGPYEEQVTIPQITGASATNTITFNGNDNILRFNGVAASRHVIELNGADYITFKRFNIVTLNAVYGWGVHLTNGADYNTIDSCIINLSASPNTTAANTAGITSSGSATSVTNAGNASYNKITNNAIMGAYHGIIFYGTNPSRNAINNIIAGNKIMDFYACGIEISQNDGTLIEKNDISRATRTEVTTFDGIRMLAGNINSVVNANRIHDTHNMAIVQTGITNGINSNVCDAPAGFENKVTNNLLYNLNSTSGIIYGINNSSSDGVYYYHNTVILDNAAATAGLTRGFQQLSTATRIDIKNNLFYITRGGAGAKHALYMGAATTTYTSDFNILYVTPVPGLNYTGFAASTNFATLADWKTGSSNDAHSLATEVVFQNPAVGNYIPIAPVLADNKGTLTGIALDIAGTNRSITTPDIGAYEFTVIPCTNPPDPGTIESGSNPVCSGKNFLITRVNGSQGIGQTYQWESSTDNLNWNPVAGATGISLPALQTVNTWYRLTVACGTTVTTPAIQVVTPLGMSGHYTIDKTSPASATSFRSFNEAYAVLQCGVSGAVVFDVVPGSGPYEEQLVMQQIPGTSATNTITFNGNGNTLTFGSLATNERAVIKLNGTDHVTFDNLSVIAQGSAATQYGWGIQLLNSADSNIVRHCTVRTAITSSTTNFAGIVIGGNATNATATGDPNCDGNSFDDNTIIGGHYGISMVANGTSALNSWNKITRNTIQDFYAYGIYVNGSFEAVIDSNTISRPSRAEVTVFNGVYFSAPSASATITRNTITNPFGGAPNSTADCFGIYFDGVNTLAGLENIVANNLIYRITGKGAVTGIFNSSSDLAWYYHNTIHLDGAADAAGATTRGYYQNGSVDTRFRNNIVSISRNSIGNKYAVYLNTTSTTVQSDRNNFYFYPGAGATYIGFRGNNIASLTEWKTLGQDNNSTTNDPLYLNIGAGNFEPSNASIDNKGLPVQPAITIDIRGAARSNATPDMGAYEFAAPVCVTPPTPGKAIVSQMPACQNSSVTLSIADNSTGQGQTYQWQTSSSLNGTYSAVSNVLENPVFAITATETAFFRAAVTCSGNTVYSEPVELVVTPSLPGGTYTIDQGAPASSSNFTSFNAAREAMKCGISGAVTFNVVAGGMPYLEQIWFDSIPGSSPVNTITFNGNGNTIQFSSSNTNERAVITLSQADYMTFNNLVIDATGTGTYGWGVLLTRDADHNTFRNCAIVTNTTSASSNYAGVVISASVTSASLAGIPLCDNNLFEANTVTGGFYGMIMAASAASPTNNNRFIKNKVSEFYSYGIYVGAANDAVIESNYISRPTRSAVTTFYGIYSIGASNNLQIAGNTIFSSFNGDAANTNNAYGVYFDANDAAPAQPSLVYNNLVYNLTGAGNIYGIYNASSNNVKYYHNTIALENTGNAFSNSSYGFYQVNEADGLELKNNSIYVTRPGSGAKYGLYFSTNTTLFKSDYNNVYVNGTGAGANNFGFNDGDRAGLNAWSAFNAQDAHSYTLDPMFTNPAAGNFTPQQAGIDNKGTPVGITSDINGSTRSNTNPDLGVYEYDYNVLPCTTPPAPGTANVTPSSGICLGANVALNLNGNSTGGGQRYIWQRAGSATATVWTTISDSLNNPYFKYQLMSPEVFFRCIVVCSGQQAASAVVSVGLNPLMSEGNYTIDPALPQSSINYQSFTAALDALKCGIAGHIRFHIAPGTYTNQVKLVEVPGMSANSTVTFLSQDGNAASVNLTFDGGLTNNYVVQFDNSSYFILRNITITPSNATYSHAIEFVGKAAHDSVVNCSLNLPVSTSVATTGAGIFGTILSGDHLVLKGNTILNGTAGIYLEGITSTLPDGYSIDSNTIKNAYYYSIYAANTRNIRINRNVIPKTGLMNTTTYGIYASNCDSAYTINNNKINIFNSGTTVYGMYLTGCHSAEQASARIFNNSILAGEANTGSQYAMYIIASTVGIVRNNVIAVNTKGNFSYGIYQNPTNAGAFHYQNNTIQSKSAATTPYNACVVAGQASTSNGGVGSTFYNNIVSHLGGGIPLMVLEYQLTNSDYNMLYTTGPTLISGANNTLYASLQAWRNISYSDRNSIVYEPAIDAVNLTPDITSPHVWAIQGRGVQIEGNDADINGSNRPVALTQGAPDLGAYEFTPTSVPVPLTATPAAPVPNTLQTFTLGTDTVTRIKWGATVPATIVGKRYSGVVPPNLAGGQPYMYFYTDFDFTGQAPVGHNIEQVYIDPWRGSIATEEEINLGRTNASAAWEVGAGSAVQVLDNIITENNLSVLDKFTGLTDGPVPVPRVIVGPADSSNMGTRFWVGYGHCQDFEQPTANEQEMLLYLAAGDKPARVTVRVNGTSWIKQYIIEANSVVVSDFIPKYGAFDARLLKEGLSTRGVSIESDMPITAYAHIYGGTSSGATMLLPVGTYGYEYYALTSKQHYSGKAYSWFYVVAAYDSTVVEITPSKPTLNGRAAGQTFTVNLKKGEVYQVLGAILSGDFGYDLTGSKVKSVANASGKCYPVAVFSGSSRTNIGCGSARPVDNGDNIIQQNFPYKAWGRRYLTAPTSNHDAANLLNGNLYKVVVRDPATVVKRNGAVLTDLIDNFYYQIETNGADYIEADKPIMVAQFLPSQVNSGCGYSGYGDPEMIYLSPIEQGIKSVRLYRNPRYKITAQYLTLIIPSEGVNSLTIDGAANFDYVYDHPNRTGYKVVVRRWTASSGQTLVKSDSAFTAITYGLGLAESYGYNAGTLVLDLNAVAGFKNVRSTKPGNSDTTCAGTPFTFNFLSTVEPTSIQWELNTLPDLKPNNNNVFQSNPVATGTVLINGVTYYQYALPSEYTMSTPGNYTANVVISHPALEGCGRMETSIPIAVKPKPKVDYTVADNCLGGLVNFAGRVESVSDYNGFVWKWDFKDAGAVSASQNPGRTFSARGTYAVNLSVITNIGCVADTTKAVTVGPAPAAVLQNGSLAVCPGSAATFTVQAPVTDAVYTWYNAASGGTSLHSGNSLTIPNVAAGASYWVGANLNGCSSEARAEAKLSILPQLVVTTPVVASAGADRLIFSWEAVPTAIAYEVSIDGGASWITPSSGTTGLTHTVLGLTVGRSVTLQVRALGGCAPAVSQSVSGTTVSDQVFAPNTFTPNNRGNAENEKFRIYSNVISQIHLMIFNQWGQKVFETRDMFTGWDGSFKGKPQSSGVYIYVADIILTNGNCVQKKGAVNLIR